MVQPITSRQLSILQFINAHPGVARDQLLRLPQVTDQDVRYLEDNDLIREREAGRCRVTHLGETVLRRA